MRERGPRRRVRRKTGVAELMVVVALLTWMAIEPAGAAQGDSGADDAGGVRIESGPRWGSVPPGAWTAYRVEVSNQGARDVQGDVVLVPRPAPPPGSEMGFFDLKVPNPSTGEPAAPVAVVERAGVARWPTYTTPVALATGTTKSIDAVVLEAPYGYAAQFHDRAGRQLASEAIPEDEAAGGDPGGQTSGRAVGRRAWSVAMVGRAGPQAGSDDPSATGVLSQVEVVRMASARDLPEDPLLLSGLQVIYLGEGAASLGSGQVDVLRTFVGLGGSLVLAGGPGAPADLAGLPDELLPMRPEATTAVARSNLAGPASPDPTVTPGPVSVVTGPLREGATVLLRAAEGAPLVVRAPYGAGQVVELAYDPFAEPFTSDPDLAASALEAGLRPALTPLEMILGGAPDGLWALLALPPVPGSRPGWPRWVTVALVGYAVLAGPAVWAARRFRRFRLALPLMAVALSMLAVIAVGGTASMREVHATIEVSALGPGGTALVTTLESTPAPDDSGRPDPAPLPLPPGMAVATVVAEPAPPGGGTSREAAQSRGFGQPGNWNSEPRGIPWRAAGPAGGGTVTAGGDGSSLLSPAQTKPGGAVLVQTLATRRHKGGIEATLRLDGTTGAAGRVTGVITNRTAKRLEEISIQFLGGRAARLTGAIEPGETREVDLALGPAVLFPPKPDRLAAKPVLELPGAAARLVGTREGLAVVVARTGSKAGSPSRNDQTQVRQSFIVAPAPYGP